MFDPAALFCAMSISSIGLGLFMYGKKQARLPQLSVGLALMVSPYFATTPRGLLSVAAMLLLTLWWAVRLGW